MALDWTFPSLPNEAFDLHDVDFADSTFFDSFLELDPPSLPGMVHALHPSDLLSVEPWAGLGCTCGLGFITCSEHNSQDAANDYSKHSCDTTDYEPSTHIPNASEPTGPASLCKESDLTCIDKVIPQPAVMDKMRLLSQKPRRATIAPSLKGLLEQQLVTNPYPTAKDVKILSSRTGLSLKTITTWFANHRARKLRAQCKPYPALRSHFPWCSSCRPPQLITSSSSIQATGRRDTGFDRCQALHTRRIAHESGISGKSEGA